MSIHEAKSLKEGNEGIVVEEITSEFIIAGYKRAYNIDVAAYFRDVPTVQILQCPKLKYRFFSPRSIAGTGALYDELQKIDWYYQEWKWEYQQIFDAFGGSGNLLEIGCGKGVFLKRMQETGKRCAGLELSDDAVEAGRRNNVSIRKSTIEEYAPGHEEMYDIVCSFQVLEHIAEVDAFISSSLRVLKKGGKFIVAVPNNDALFFRERNLEHRDGEYQKTLLLNLPPHHMGLWNRESLENLQNVYPIRVDSFLFEPIAWWRKRLNYSILKNSKLPKPFQSLPGSLVNPLLLLRYKKHFKQGDTIIAIFTKQ